VRTPRALAAGAVLLALAGCPFHSRRPVPGPREGEWAEVRTAATRRGQIYDGLIHRATATATHLGLPEREARARRLGEWLGWTAEELDKRLAAERAEADRFEEFVLALYTADRKSNDLDAPQSVWRLAVAAEEGVLLPSRVEALDLNATVFTLYPFVGTFDTVYLVRFPRAPKGPLAGRAFSLELASALGKIELDYGEPDGVDRPAPAPTVP
jgi:hypothetical protein